MIVFCKNLLSGAKFPYTFGGVHEQHSIKSNGRRGVLVCLYSSGIFVPLQNAVCDIWLCGGGGSGMFVSQITESGTIYAYLGGGGGYTTLQTGVNLQSHYACTATIGNGGSPTQIIDSGYGKGEPSLFKIGSTEIRAHGAGWGGSIVRASNGGSGGGLSYFYSQFQTVGSGQGTTTYPFGDTVNFQPHCSGGGGMGYADHRPSNLVFYSGGDGGADGSNGNLYTIATAGTAREGRGGSPGAGNGGFRYTDIYGSTTYTDGTAATYFGCGGGYGYGTSVATAGKPGYRGVVYLFFPY